MLVAENTSEWSHDRGRRQRFVVIGSVTQFTEEELEIITLSEPGEL